jgi:mannitol-1-/sugar-/sorbitol-6-/2-deoxyglucose-6-phosphatase
VARDVDAVIFDLDGVLIDSEPLWERVERAVFAEVGVSLTTEDCVLTRGMRCDEVVAFWFRRRPWTGASPGDIQRRIIDGMADAIEREVEPCPGAHDAIAAASELGVPLAIASSSPTRLIEAAVRRLGAADVMRALVSAEHEEFGKPHPAVYLTAAAALAVDPARCVAIEDSAFGVRAARAAGMRCIAVPAPAQRDDIEPLASRTLTSLLDLRVEHLLAD